jgi:hydrogenase nickel incorporation protein HypB
MCTVCGCGEGETKVGHAHSHDHAHDHSHDHAHDHSHSHDHDHDHAHPHDHQHGHDHEHVLPDGAVVRHSHGHKHQHSHDHDHGHDHHHGHGHHHHEHDHDHGHAHGGDDHAHDHEHDMDMGAGPAGVSVGGMSQSRLISLEQDILAKNDAFAAANRRLFAAAGIFTLNLMSSPGSGKTTLLVETLKALKGELTAAVIEGDQQTSADAERIRATGVPALQINTGKGCHLDAQMITQAVGRLNVAAGSALFIENVGNLVCPAGFDLGEAAKVVVLSVTEGEDKPLKYPNMFAAADLLVVTKTDLLPYLDFDVAAMLANARKIKPGLQVIQTSAKTGEGMADWLAWVEAGAAKAVAARG